jgi:hypothetical protein
MLLPWLLNSLSDVVMGGLLAVVGTVAWQAKSEVRELKEALGLVRRNR